MELAHYFQAGGWPMYLLVLTLMVSLLASVALPVVAFIAGKRGLALAFSMVLAALGLVAAGIGAFGRAWGMNLTEQAVVHVNPADKEIILMAGSGESRVCLAFGLMIAVLPLAAACIALGRAVTDKIAGLAIAGALVLALGVAFGVGGLAARQANLVKAETAYVNADPSQREMLLAFGRAAASGATTTGLAVGVPLCLVGAGLLFAASRKPAAAAAG